MWRTNRRVERAFVEGHVGRRAPWVRDRLRRDGRARAHHDRLHAPLRALSRDDVSAFELDEVGAWLARDLGIEPLDVPANSPANSVAIWRAAWVAIGVLVLAWVGWRGSDRWQEARGGALGEHVAVASGLRARGAGERPALAFEALCGPRIRFARPDGCRIDEELTFAFALDPTPAMDRAADDGTAQLVLFGLDEAGDVAYYAPTPSGHRPVAARVDDQSWRSVGFGVQLHVNHVPGQLRVFALWTTHPATVADVDRWAARLRSDTPDPSDQRPWTERAGVIGSHLCPVAEACAAAQLELNLRPGGRPTGN